MKKKLLITTVASIVLGSTTVGYAGDYNSGIVTKSPAEEVYTDVEFGSGWYIRGDISYNLGARQQTSSQFLPALGATVEGDYEDAIGVRAGFGYIFNPAFRMDFTAEQTFNSEFSGSRSVDLVGLEEVTGTIGGVVVTAQQPTNSIFGVESITSDYDATNVMVNGYFDLPTFGRFTPYIGGGVGFSRIEYNERRTLTCIPTSVETCGGITGGAQGERVEDVVIVDDEDVSYQFAYQLSVGTAYQLTENLDLDIGYSYLATNDGPEINYADGTAIESDAYSVHKVNVGLRYELW